jgi:hypothetical protein
VARDFDAQKIGLIAPAVSGFGGDVVPVHLFGSAVGFPFVAVNLAPLAR